jgi:hypothetical protein
MPEDKDSQTAPRVPRVVSHRGRLYVALFALAVVSMVAVGVVVSRDDQPSSSSSTSSTSRQSDGSTSTSITSTVSRRTEITARLREILEIRDRALLARDARLLNDVYTVDCECLEDGRALIHQLRKENIVWKGVQTDITIQTVEEVNDRLWIVVGAVRTPSVRIETESGRLVRTVPPERNVVRFALAKGSPLGNLAGANVTDLRGFVLVRKRCCAGTPKPQDAEEWLLGHASTFG